MIAIITNKSENNTLCKNTIFDFYAHIVRHNETISVQFQLTKVNRFCLTWWDALRTTQNKDSLNSLTHIWEIAIINAIHDLHWDRSGSTFRNRSGAEHHSRVYHLICNGQTVRGLLTWWEAGPSLHISKIRTSDLSRSTVEAAVRKDIHIYSYLRM